MYPSGDVAERWQMKRRLRSGRGRNFCTAVLKNFGHRNRIKGPHSKHSRVCHDCISVNPLFIGVSATLFRTFRKPHLAVFSQFGNQALPLQFHMETYRSGHNGADSKSVREQSPASSNLAVSAKNNESYLWCGSLFFCGGVRSNVVRRSSSKCAIAF